MKKNAERNVDFTQGNIVRQLLRFALPLLLSSLIQLLYNTVDLIFVGRFVGKEASAAVGAGSMLITLLVGLFTGVSIGVSVVVSKAFGAHNDEKVGLSISTAVGTSVYCGIILLILGMFLSPTILRLMNTPEEILSEAVTYLRIYFIGIISVVTYNMCSGCLRAVGNSRFPMFIQLVGGLLNLVLDAAFVAVLPLGVAGVGWATVIGQTLTAVASLICLIRTVPGVKFSFGLLKINFSVLHDILKVGIPAGVQSMVITLSNVLVQSQINSLGVDAIAAFTAYFKVELIVYLPIMAFGQTMTTFTGQNMGAGKTERVRTGFRICTLMSAGYAIVSAAFSLLFGKTLFGVFSTETAVIELGVRIISVSFPFYWIYSILENLSDTMRGAGNSVSPMIFILLNICLLRTVLLYIFMYLWHDVGAVAAVYPISWAGAAVCLTIYYKLGKWSKKTFSAKGD